MINLLNNNEEKDKSLSDIMDITKLIVLILIAIISFSYLIKSNSIFFVSKGSLFQIPYVELALIVFVTIYCIWMLFHFIKIKSKNKMIVQIIENIFFITVITALIIISKNSIQQYKYLYVFIIIISTIEVGIKFGIFIGIISSSIILSLDIIFLPNDIINQLFENDLIIVGVFILIVLPLGYYVELEKEKLEEKNYMLNELSNEVREENLQRKKFEESLLKNQACYDLLIENAKDAIFVHRNNKIIFVNNSAAELVGCKDKNKLINQSILDFQVKGEEKKGFGDFEKLYSGSYSKKFLITTIKNNNNEEINVESTSTLFTYQGESTILTIFRDITFEKEVQKLQDDVEENIKLLNESREYTNMMIEFIANISHELKTPLNLIHSSVQLLEVYEDSGSIDLTEKIQRQKSNRRDYLSIIKQNCFRLIRLINNLLDISKSDSGFLKLNAHNQDIVYIIESITMSVVPYIESKGITVIFDTNTEEKIISCDSDKLERVILNILSNAIKFTDAGGSIFVNIIEEDEYIFISIKDTGVGIPEDKLNSIFDRFMQVDKTLRRNSEGTGIGLAIVKSFIEMHNGIIEVKSKFGEGSEFIIKLPNLVTEDGEEEGNFYIENINAVLTEFSDL